METFIYFTRQVSLKDCGMDPVTMTPVMLVVTALATGAATGGAEQAVKSAYEGLKALLHRKHPHIDVAGLERLPNSKRKQDSVAEDLEAVSVDQDQELLEAAQNLIRLVAERAPGSATAAGFDLEHVRAGASITLEDISTAGSFRAKDLNAKKDVSIKGVRVGQSDSETAPTRGDRDRAVNNDPNA